MKVAYYVTAGANAGEIDYIITYPPDVDIPAAIAADLTAGYSWLEILPTEPENISAETHWVSAGAFALRPQIITDTDVAIVHDGGATADGKFEVACPAGTVVFSHYDATEYTLAAAETFTFQTLRPGEWVFEFDFPFPNLDATVRVSAHAD